MKRDRELDALLEVWKRKRLPDPFPPLRDALGPPWLGGAFGEIMHRVWRDADWRRHVPPTARPHGVAR